MRVLRRGAPVVGAAPYAGVSDINVSFPSSRPTLWVPGFLGTPQVFHHRRATCRDRRGGLRHSPNRPKLSCEQPNLDHGTIPTSAFCNSKINNPPTLTASAHQEVCHGQEVDHSKHRRGGTDRR